MIVVDSSAVLAIFLGEPDAARLARAIGDDDAPLMSAASVVETSIVLRALKKVPPGVAEQWLDEFLRVGGIAVEPVTEAQAAAARAAHARFGKGTGHPAALTFGDCFPYALAKTLGAPLLFKGDDFGRTDIVPA
ncbi:MAG TPA: type II toxin-antitoxin system VapC family toxin [Azospirillaceae bacterium]|nr:type II toxin-antitoxin system VapC family toxin [Azospirillaceae bacterium]